MNVELLQSLRKNFESGVTRSYSFRKQQLLALKKAIQQHEQAIAGALYKDLKKSPEEAYVSETGLIYAELNVALKNLAGWMEPQRVGTDLANLPSVSKIYRDPLGVVLIIAPWNYPLQLTLIPLIGAIAGGNCAVIKPSELAPATADIIQKIIESIFPEDYVLTVQGDGAQTVPAMMTAYRFDHIFYTGSIPVGKAIYKMAAEQLVTVTLELGGKSPAVVEADANISVAARRIVMGKFLNAGQTCIAPDYLLVHQSVKDELVGKMIESIEQFYGKDAAASYDYGKIITEKRFDVLAEYLKQGNVIYGGSSNREALFISPTIVDKVPGGAALMQQEIFGPILPVITYNTVQEALQIIKQHENPLAFYLFTSSKKKEEHWIASVPFGGGCINNADLHFTNHHLPFGGVGNSGMGAYHGKFTFDTFTRMKPVMKSPTWFDPSIKYPSFKGKLKFLKWFIR